MTGLLDAAVKEGSLSSCLWFAGNCSDKVKIVLELNCEKFFAHAVKRGQVDTLDWLLQQPGMYSKINSLHRIKKILRVAPSSLTPYLRSKFPAFSSQICINA